MYSLTYQSLVLFHWLCSGSVNIKIQITKLQFLSLNYKSVNRDTEWRFFFISGCGAIFLYFVNSRKGDSFTGETNDTLARGFAGPLQVPLVSGGSGRSVCLVTEVRLGEGMNIICVLYTKSMLSLIFCFAAWFFSSVLMTDSTDLKHFLHIPPSHSWTLDLSVTFLIHSILSEFNLSFDW